MDNLLELTNRLEEIAQRDEREPLSAIGGYIIGATLEEFRELYDTNPLIEQISDLASDLETNNGSPAEIRRSWTTLKLLIARLRQNLDHSPNGDRALAASVDGTEDWEVIIGERQPRDVRSV